MSSRSVCIRERPKPARSNDNDIRLIHESMLEHPKISVRRRSQDAGVNISRESVRRILKLDLGAHAYRIQVKQKLNENDIEARLEMCEWFQGQIASDVEWLRNVWFSDEAHFYLDGQDNSKNSVHWDTQPPQYVLEKPLHSVKCTAWLAMSSQGLIGPYFFEDDDGLTATVNADRYLQVLKRFWSALGRQGLDRTVQWFQQDGASTHASNQSLAWLREHFNHRIISRRCDANWASHSPDLSPLDFFAWGYLKSRVYEGHPQSIEALKLNIVRCVRAIPQAKCTDVIQNFSRRIEMCIKCRGAHFEQLL